MDLLINRLNILKPNVVVLLGKTHISKLKNCLNLSNQPFFTTKLSTRTVEGYFAHIKNLKFVLIVGDALSSRGFWGGKNGKYKYAYDIGQLAKNYQSINPCLNNKKMDFII